MKKILPAFVLLLPLTAVFGQVDSLNMSASPKGGLAALALVYYKIDFAPEEVAYLRLHEAELIFTVNENGKATLEKVNEIEMRSIIDSMMRVNDQLPPFYPEVVDGKPRNTLYFMRLRWPHYEDVRQIFPSPYNIRHDYFGRRLDEFEFIEYRGPRFDMLIGGVGNTVGGSVTEYNYSGGGVKFDMMFYGQRNWGGGMVMTFHGNRMRKEYPITTVLPQNRSRVTGFIGIAVAKLFDDTPAGQFSIQFEPCFSMQNIVTVDPQVRNKPVQAIGFSPGLVLNYAKTLGRGRMAAYYYQATAIRHFMNFHLALRPMMLDVPQASGILYEAGVSWRLAMRQAVDMKLKE